MDKKCKLRQVCKADWDLLAINIEETRLDGVEEKRREEEPPLKSQAPSPERFSLDDSENSGSDSGVSV